MGALREVAALSAADRNWARWGEKSALSKKFLDKVAAILPNIDDSTESQVASQQTGATATLGGQLARLVDLHESGHLTDEEFTQAKATLLAGA